MTKEQAETWCLSQAFSGMLTTFFTLEQQCPKDNSMTVLRTNSVHITFITYMDLRDSYAYLNSLDKFFNLKSGTSIHEFHSIINGRAASIMSTSDINAS